MSRWQVVITVDASICVEVEADDAEQAKDRAWEQASVPGICHQCSDDITLGDLLEAVEATPCA